MKIRTDIYKPGLDVGEGYRRLQLNEETQAGDEIFDEVIKPGTWQPWRHKITIKPSNAPFRRKESPTIIL